MTRMTYVSSIIEKHKTKIPKIKTSKHRIMNTIKVSTLMATTLMLITTSLGSLPIASALGPLTNTATTEADMDAGLTPGAPALDINTGPVVLDDVGLSVPPGESRTVPTRQQPVRQDDRMT